MFCSTAQRAIDKEQKHVEQLLEQGIGRTLEEPGSIRIRPWWYSAVEHCFSDQFLISEAMKGSSFKAAIDHPATYDNITGIMKKR